MGQLLPGPGYEFLYPRHNFRFVPQSLERRRIIVSSIRDISANPLAPETYSLNPMLQRGRFLVTGHDLDRGAERSFYLESMTEIRSIQEVSTSRRSMSGRSTADPIRGSKKPRRRTPGSELRRPISTARHGAGRLARSPRW